MSEKHTRKLAERLGFIVGEVSGCPVIIEDGETKPADLEHRVLWGEVVVLLAQSDKLLDALKLVLKSAPEMDGLTDEYLLNGLDDEDEETQQQVKAFIAARAAIKEAEAAR